MNNDLEQFSEERLKEIAQHGLNRGIYSDDLKSLARIALSVKQAKPVAVLYKNGDVLTREECSDDKVFAICCKVETPLYTTPQPAHTEQDGWIKCSERMPEKQDMYQCWGRLCPYDDEDEYFCAHYNPNAAHPFDPVEDEADSTTVHVTHWMPLPAAPKPDGE